MKDTALNNINVTVWDKRILELARIVEEVKQSEEWEVVKMNILEIGMVQGSAATLVNNIESAMRNFSVDLQHACAGLGTTMEEYKNAKERIALWEKDKAYKMHTMDNAE